MNEERLLLLGNPEATQTVLWEKNVFHPFSETRIYKKQG